MLGHNPNRVKSYRWEKTPTVLEEASPFCVDLKDRYRNIRMAERSPFEEAQTYGLKRPEVVILFYVTAWFNGKTVSVHDRPLTSSSA